MLKIILIGSVVVGGAAIVLGLKFLGIYTPDTAALRWNAMTPLHRGRVLDIVPLADGENPLMFYSSGFLSFKADGNLVTDKAVYSWSDETGKFEMQRVTYDKISDIEVRYSDEWTEDSQIIVWYDGANDETEVVVLLASNEKGGDKEMVRLIETYAKRQAYKGQIEDDPGQGVRFANPAERVVLPAASRTR